MAAIDPNQLAAQQAALQQQQLALQQQMAAQQMQQVPQVNPADPNALAQQQALQQQMLQQQALQQQQQQQQLQIPTSQQPIGTAALPQQGTVQMIGATGVAQPTQPAGPSIGGARNLQVTIRRGNSASLGFTPFKFSVLDAKERRVGGFDFTELLNKCDFAKDQGGLPVQAVDPNGCAAQAGLQAWDVVMGVNNSDIRQLSGEQCINHIKQQPVGQDLVLLILRSDNPPPAPVVTAPPPLFSCCFGKKN